ncbi:MAG: hypothetical protein U9N04_02575 [Patescibacteria group bacterium]|nr:hypothetical protein [Patescibacteria group bacterium]
MNELITILGTVFSGISIILFCVVLKIIFVDLPKYEKQINKLYKEKEEKIKKERRSTKLTMHIEGAIENIEKEYNPKIKELERKRRFLLDKIPFLRK